jgi:hypothetical protein
MVFPITRIDQRIRMSDIPGAGIDGRVYLGIGGREFAVDSGGNDFEQGSDTTDVNATIQNAELNDPRSPQLHPVGAFPVYVRLEPHGGNPDWCVDRVEVRFNGGSTAFYATWWTTGQNLWLGQRIGKICYLSGR